jgi:(1->4)-alpha-D-glucan 1-alpha-D-glucosylmutase
MRVGRPDLFSAMEYAPLEVAGTRARHALAFVRRNLAVVVPVLVGGLAGAWNDTTVVLPTGRWTDGLTGAEWNGGQPVEVAALLSAFPVAVLTSDG